MKEASNRPPIEDIPDKPKKPCGNHNSGRRPNKTVDDIISPEDVQLADDGSIALPQVLDLGDNGIGDEWLDIPEAALLCLMGRSAGLGYKKIAKVFKCEWETIRDYCKRYDPKSVFKLTPAQIKAFRAAQWAKLEATSLVNAQLGAEQGDISPAQSTTMAAIARDKQAMLSQSEQVQDVPGTILLRLKASE